MDLGHLWDDTADRHPHAIALVDPHSRYTYEALYAEIESLALSLYSIGVGAGERVAVLLKNRKEAIVSFWAAQKIGAVFVPLNYHLSPSDVKSCIIDTEPKVLIYEKFPFLDMRSLTRSVTPILISENDSWADISYHELIQSHDPLIKCPPRKADDIAAILYTSGTTGPPKGVSRTHYNVIAGALSHIVHNHYTYNERLMGSMPLYHTMGLHALVAITLLNGRYVISSEFNADLALSQIVEEKVDALYMMPSMFHALLRTCQPGRDVSSVHKLTYAGATMNEELIHDCMEVFGGNLHVFANHYGSTEIYTHSVYNILQGKPGCAGNLAEDHVRLVNAACPHDDLSPGKIGEIWINGTSPEAFPGYWRRSDLTRPVLQDGWYHTGDLGYQDNEGDFFVVGRIDDMIIVSGEHVMPEQVENVLSRHAKVLEVAVTGETDTRWGQIVVAYVVPAEPHLSAQELDSFCKNAPDLTIWARPRKYQFVSIIPRTPSGKVIRRELKNLEGTI